MKKLLLLLSLVCIKQVESQNLVTIPDAHFATYLQSLIPAAMTGNKLDTTSILVTTTTHSINVYGDGIANLSGIQYFKSLTYLNCGSNSLTSLPSLPNSIKSLWCNINSLTSLPVLPNSLDTLDCQNNYISSLPTLPDSLTVLFCGSNSFTSIPTLPNSLKNLNCWTGLLTSLPNLPNSLKILTCPFNNLTSLPNLPTSLTNLGCWDNQLTSLPALPNSLTYFDCADNNIKCFPILPTGITNPMLFDISNNPFTCLPNHTPAMNSFEMTTPLCDSGNVNGCAIAGINQTSVNNKQINVYPNPTSDQFFIEANATDKLTVDLYDVNGRHLFSANVIDKSNINISNLNEGIYTLTIKSADHVTNKKLVIVR